MPEVPSALNCSRFSGLFGGFCYRSGLEAVFGATWALGHGDQGELTSGLKPDPFFNHRSDQFWNGFRVYFRAQTKLISD